MSKLNGADRAEEAEPTEGGEEGMEVTLGDLLTDAFLAEHSDFANIEQLFANCGYTVNSEADFQAIPASDWNAFIRSRTRFDTWEQMLEAAYRAYVEGRLFDPD
ncbi:hypothetical protein [Ferrimonas balearica]|uniref:hypothetical protein n=1 Tax=Ferrimonas balearica TaxID=44012 RepID=UPI001F265FA4|nr:hypothetical protein [Ferrimonas balearica]MBY6016806.1 hypothetical protein [Halomonas denitrificans]MBY6094904.1 hypothetical protein [Ferrimonas balearica]